MNLGNSLNGYKRETKALDGYRHHIGNTLHKEKESDQRPAPFIENAYLSEGY